MAIPDSKRREVAVTIGSFIVLLATTIPVTRMLGRGWDVQGFTYTFVHSLVDAAGVDIDVAVIIPAGIAFTWLIMFSLDTTKRVQALLTWVIAVPLFLGALYLQGKWFSTVSWIERGYWFIPAVLIGGAVGSYSRVIESRYKLFPMAARGLYGLTAIATVALFIDLLINGTVELPSTVLYLVASVSFLFVLNQFTQYKDDREVTLVSSDPAVETDVLAGLFGTARNRFDGISLVNPESLNSAISVENEFVDTPVGFQYRHPDRWIFAPLITVHTRGFRLSDIDDNKDEIIRRIQSESNATVRIRRFLKRHCLSMFPKFVRSGVVNVTDRYPTPTERLLTLMSERDVIMLAASYDELRDEEGNPTDIAAQFAQICRWYRGPTGTEVLVTITNGEHAVEDYKNEEMKSTVLGSQEVRDFVRSRAEIGDCSVVRLTNKRQTEPIELEGAEDILLGM